LIKNYKYLASYLGLAGTSSPGYVGLATAPGPSNLGVVGAPYPARPNGYH